MIVFRCPEGRLCKAALARGSDHGRHQLSADPLAPHRWIAVEGVELSYSAAVGVLVLRRPHNSEGDHAVFPLRDEHLLARVGARDFAAEAINRRLNGLQIWPAEDVSPPLTSRRDVDQGHRLNVAFVCRSHLDPGHSREPTALRARVTFLNTGAPECACRTPTRGVVRTSRPTLGAWTPGHEIRGPFQGLDTRGTGYVVILIAAFVVVMLILILLAKGVESLWHRVRPRSSASRRRSLPGLPWRHVFRMLERIRATVVPIVHLMMGTA